MNSTGWMRKIRVCVPLLLVLLFPSCGDDGIDLAGGGTGGTGISTGSISGFGSVVVNDVHFKTDDNVAPRFLTKKTINREDKSRQKDREVFSEGMVVTVQHPARGDSAREIDYMHNLRGPVNVIVSGADNVIEVLGFPVVVENASAFQSLRQDDVVEVSGFVDSAGRVRATYVARIDPPLSPPQFEIKGFVSGSGPAGFVLGPLPGGSGATAAVSYPPGGPPDGTYVQVTTNDRERAGGVISATRVETFAPRTAFRNHAEAGLAGLVTKPWAGDGNDLSMEVEGKRVEWNAGTAFVGGTPDDARQPDREVRVHGLEDGGTLSAARIVIR